MSTSILAVLKDSGEKAFCPKHPNAILFEVVAGPHQGKRGCDSCLFDLVGPIQWDKSQVVSYETGEKRLADSPPWTPPDPDPWTGLYLPEDED